MDNVLKALYPLWNKAKPRVLSKSGIVSRSPGYLIAAHVTGTAASTSTADFYDGVDTNGEQGLSLQALYAGFDDFCPSLPTYYEKGLYVALGATATKVSIVFIASRKEAIDNV